MWKGSENKNRSGGQYEVTYALSIGTKIIDLWWPWTAKTHSDAEKMRILEPTAKIWKKIDPYYQRQKCRPMTLVSGNIRHVRIFAGSSTWRGPQVRVGLSTTAIFGDLSGYFFANFRYKASNIIWRYASPCWPVTGCKMNDLEWPWVAISCQNPFSASTSWLRAFDFQK